MEMLSPRAASALLSARLSSRFDRFIELFFDEEVSALSYVGFQELISDALEIPDLNLARRWVSALLKRDLSSREVAKIIAYIPAQKACSEHPESKSSGQLAEGEGDPNACEAALYWCCGGDYQFSERCSLKQNFSASGRLEKVNFEIGAMEKNCTAVRFDISNRPGAYLVESLRLLGCSNEQLWCWSGTLSDVGRIVDVDLVCPASMNAFGVAGVAAYSNDPQFQLTIDDGILDQLSRSGGRLELVVRAFV
ncbi:hypothetical protein OOT55_04545 [Marinimicrobium sp. C6131]|uniref:hypothetical protein n=1 Tax=Marinimicrobium sp. C6131 TaxID=3022676 RepID=UPI00223DE998|nr:hypothetical protein [Marinimicrobium sp. C6131]UZJ45330.1 hypothetical protein OOT55_04545 [Marinimicrobium sp. C6131]